MKRRAFLVGAVVTTTGCLDYLGENSEEITDPEDVEIVYDDLLREDIGSEEERVYIWGIVRNVGDRRLSYVEIRATFYDEDDEELETVIENVPDVTSGDEWEFEIEFPDFGERARAVRTYELEIVTGV